MSNNVTTSLSLTPLLPLASGATSGPFNNSSSSRKSFETPVVTGGGASGICIFPFLPAKFCGLTSFFISSCFGASCFNPILVKSIFAVELPNSFKLSFVVPDAIRGRKTNSASPNFITSSGPRTAVSTFSPFTKVPFVLPISDNCTSVAVSVIQACTEEVALFFITMSFVSARPIKIFSL